MHSTGPGAVQTVGITPKENRCYGMELAQRVYEDDRPYLSNAFYRQFPDQKNFETLTKGLI